MRAAQKWGAGQKQEDNGAILFVFTGDRKVRIEVGYGLEGAMPDVTAKRIIEEEIVPRFRPATTPAASRPGPTRSWPRQGRVQGDGAHGGRGPPGQAGAVLDLSHARALFRHLLRAPDDPAAPQALFARTAPAAGGPAEAGAAAAGPAGVLEAAGAGPAEAAAGSRAEAARSAAAAPREAGKGRPMTNYFSHSTRTGSSRRSARPRSEDLRPRSASTSPSGSRRTSRRARCAGSTCSG